MSPELYELQQQLSYLIDTGHGDSAAADAVRAKIRLLRQGEAAR